jgi:cytochrome bd-type quinol oxidase subunit 1
MFGAVGSGASCLMTDFFVTLLIFAFFVLLIGLLIWTLVDLARNRDLGRWTKVICVAAIVLAGFVGIPMYWLVRHVAKSRAAVTSEQSPEPNSTGLV